MIRIAAATNALNRRSASAMALIVALGISLVAASASESQAASIGPGSPDPAFTPVITGSGSATTNEVFTGLAVDASGRPVVIDRLGNSSSIVRRTTTGAVDSTFNSGRPVSFSVAGSPVLLNDLAIQSNGRIVFVGSVGGARLVVGRLTTSGQLDTTFGGTGLLVRDGSNPNFVPSDLDRVVIAPDGRIFAFGNYVKATDPAVRPLAMLVYSSTGALDTSYTAETSGIALVGDPSGRYVISDATLLDTGAPAIVGSREDGTTADSFAGSVGSLAGLTVDTFDFVPAADDRLYGAAPAGDGQLLVSLATVGDASIGRLRVGDELFGNLVLDTTFGTSGFRSLSGAAPAGDLTRTRDGAFVMAGNRATAGNNWVAVRVLPNGQLDVTSFGSPFLWDARPEYRSERGSVLRTVLDVEEGPNGTLYLAHWRFNGSGIARPTLTRVINRQAELKTTVAAGRIFAPSSLFDLKVRVANTGPDALPATVTVTLPTTDIFFGGNPNCVIVGTKIQCTTPTINPGSSELVTLQVRRATDAALSVGITARSTGYDSSLANNTVTFKLAAQSYRITRTGSTCGSVSRPCAIAQTTSSTARPFLLKATAKYQMPASVRDARLRIEKKVGSSWALVSSPRVAVTFNDTGSATFAWPLALRRVDADYRIRLVVDRTAATAAGTTANFYLRVR